MFCTGKLQCFVPLDYNVLSKGITMEIEKKYLVKSIPFSLDKYDRNDVSQGYISTSPVIRIRKKDDKHILTIKGGGLSVREEYELNITAEEYENLSGKVDGNLIEKTRYLLPDKDFGESDSTLTIELDVFHGLFEGLIYAEVEFPDEESMKKYNPPAFFDREVTDYHNFTNASLSEMSRSDIDTFLHGLGIR